ncbi:MAG: sensor histidine kinase [Dokdonella sp.]|uniref:sensor histidine kinase n=1 Tax=Dokdonella sp. TaxID=2291710 RepID=UPI0025B88BDC|nr:sensor histidine kinase [Dokdonella sp.]MBZ0223093.1 sensor histidine kinase [Dokdonella sp.]MCC7255495.1 sensor histidine kinase [Dokdonella sp.]
MQHTIRSVVKARWQALIGPDHAELGMAPLWSLLYLFFLFANWANAQGNSWLWWTLLSLVAFLPLYFAIFHLKGRALLICGAAIALLGLLLTPINPGANTYLIYAACVLPHAGIAPRAIVTTIAAVIVLYVIEMSLIGFPQRYVLLIAGITFFLATAITLANHFQREKDLRQAELKLSHEEVRRLGALAERERIGRDLHDLLGHTLSLITLKSELAARLFERDAPAARREIIEVERVARDALAQVRRAVSGIRAAGLAAELASARLLLESGDVRLDYHLDDVGLTPEVETVLALAVREAVTNIQRHARASRATIRLGAQDGVVCLSISDDGRGAVIEPGNGLLGMRERLRGLGGELSIHAERGVGTRLEVRVPLPPAPSVDAVTASNRIA